MQPHAGFKHVVLDKAKRKSTGWTTAFFGDNKYIEKKQNRSCPRTASGSCCDTASTDYEMQGGRTEGPLYGAAVDTSNQTVASDSSRSSGALRLVPPFSTGIVRVTAVSLARRAVSLAVCLLRNLP